ncbi:hypothetical protein KRM28CT15_32350 [Krasilnikovia sp. M28-CT-15]
MDLPGEGAHRGGMAVSLRDPIIHEGPQIRAVRAVHVATEASADMNAGPGEHVVTDQEAGGPAPQVPIPLHLIRHLTSSFVIADQLRPRMSALPDISHLDLPR